MVRISKQSEKRGMSPRKTRSFIGRKTGPKSDVLSKGYREHPNALSGEFAGKAFIPKIN